MRRRTASTHVQRRERSGSGRLPNLHRLVRSPAGELRPRAAERQTVAAARVRARNAAEGGREGRRETGQGKRRASHPRVHQQRCAVWGLAPCLPHLLIAATGICSAPRQLAAAQRHPQPSLLPPSATRALPPAMPAHPPLHHSGRQLILPLQPQAAHRTLHHCLCAVAVAAKGRDRGMGGWWWRWWASRAGGVGLTGHIGLHGQGSSPAQLTVPFTPTLTPQPPLTHTSPPNWQTSAAPC